MHRPSRVARESRVAITSSIALLLIVAGCRSRPAVVAVRLVDLYKPEVVEGRVAVQPAGPRTEFRFDAPAPSPAPMPAGAPAPSPSPFAATRGWEAGPGVSKLEVREGRLIGRSTTDAPMIRVDRTQGSKDQDLLHEVEVRVRVSAGTRLAMGFPSAEKVNFQETLDGARAFGWPADTPIVAGDEMKTYVLRSRFSIPASRIRHVLIRPTDVPGATFEIESVRLVFRKEHLSSVPSGIGWHGLGEVYRETLVARSPETLRFDVSLPGRPWLDLALGTLEGGPVTFKVGLRRRGASSGDEVLLERTVTTPHRWEAAPLDLARFAGRDVTLTLSLAAEKPGSLGLWGAPVLRSRGAMPQEATGRRVPLPRPQGVILIWADTLRRDHLDVYGYQRETAPTIKRMAGEGRLFRDCLVQATWTKVSTPSLLTSLYPAAHGVREFSDRLPNAANTLAESYRQAGYATLSMASVIFVGKFTNLHQGFEELHEDASLANPESSKTARPYVDRLLPWLEAHRDGPFFVLLHVTDPHDPYRPAEPYDTLWADAAKNEDHERHGKDVRKFIADPLMKRFGMPTRDEMVKAGLDPDAYVGHDRDWYDGSIRGMDAEIARLLERLRALGLADRTLVVFTGDHGEEFLEHGRMFHGQSTYGELANVPLVIWGPGVVQKGPPVDVTVETIDLMPTLLEISRLPSPQGMHGRSLLPLLSGSAAAARDWAGRSAVVEKAATSVNVGGAPPPRDTESFAVVSGGWKLVHNLKRPAGAPEHELYDHAKDPLNLHDVAKDHADLVQRLSKDLEAWRTKATAARLKPDSAAAETLSREELERLRALGYVQ